MHDRSNEFWEEVLRRRAEDAERGWKMDSPRTLAALKRYHAEILRTSKPGPRLLQVRMR